MKVTIMVGLPGSGKSVMAKELAKEWGNTEVISTDEIRHELYGSEDIQDNPEQVFALAYSRARGALANGMDVIFDATNVRTKYRKQLKKELEGEDVTFEAFVMDTPIDVCKERNAARERIVPEEVIDKMSRYFCNDYATLCNLLALEGFHGTTYSDYIYFPDLFR